MKLSICCYDCSTLSIGMVQPESRLDSIEKWTCYKCNSTRLIIFLSPKDTTPWLIQAEHLLTEFSADLKTYSGKPWQAKGFREPTDVAGEHIVKVAAALEEAYLKGYKEGRHHSSPRSAPEQTVDKPSPGNPKRMC